MINLHGAEQVSRIVNELLKKRIDTIGKMLASRMELFVDLFKLAVLDLRVDLRCLNIGMPQHLLDQSQVGSTC
jgi:hypothetical protein